jgi:hypothetical protein
MNECDCEINGLPCLCSSINTADRTKFEEKEPSCNIDDEGCLSCGS